MNESTPLGTDQGSEPEVYPIEPHYHPIHKFTRLVYDILASSRLAMALLVTILVCCVIGATIWRGAEAGRLIFGTLWFNGILVLLVINVACCFFGRIWGRRVTVVSFGMILFHLSFVAILGGIIYNSLFYFRGNIRLTEGEVLKSGDPQSYDTISTGRFFDFARLKGETSLIKMHAGYKVASEDKRAAYEVAVGDGADKTTGIIYITHKLSHRGFDYFNDREGYSLLLILSDKNGQSLYGSHFPLQSVQQKVGGFVYGTGYKDGDTVRLDASLFPVPPQKPLFALQAVYTPSKLQERGGDVHFKAYELDRNGQPDFSKMLADGKSSIDVPIAIGNYLVSAKEVRYWVAMNVRYEPGKPIVLGSLWAGLAGMIITTAGRIFRKRRA